jgi:hypothetical protein
MSAELIIAVENDGRSLQARHADGRTARGVLRGFDHDSLTRRTIRLFERWMRADKFCDSKEIAVFGQHLYQLLFDVEIERLFEESLREAQTSGERLRLQLSFEAGAAELANLPWEFLHYPRGNCFLCSHVNLVLSRFMPRHARKPLRTEGALRLLVAVSKPSDLGPVLEPRVIESIQRLSEAYPVQVDVLRETTVAAFTERMRTFKPHVLHFIGHGNFDVETSSGEVALLKADGTAIGAAIATSPIGAVSQSCRAWSSYTCAKADALTCAIASAAWRRALSRKACRQWSPCNIRSPTWLPLTSAESSIRRWWKASRSITLFSAAGKR